MEASNDFENTINLEFTGKSPRGAAIDAKNEAINRALGSANNEDEDLAEYSQDNTLTAQDPCLDGLVDISGVVDGITMDRDISADADDFGR